MLGSLFSVPLPLFVFVAKMGFGGIVQLAALISSALALHLPRQSNGTGYSVKTPPLDTPWYVSLVRTM
jgi:hypothetical protein